MRFLFVLGLMFTMISCSHPYLSVRSDYFSRKDLASYHLDTPDPRKNQALYGQRIYTHWYLPSSAFSEDKTFLEIRVHLKNGQELIEKKLLKNRIGRYTYPIQGDVYTESGGLLSYLVQIIADGKVVAESRHKFYRESIESKKTSK